MSPRSGVKRPRPRPQPAQGLFRAPARATFVCGDKSSQKHRQKLRFCTSSARYTALVCKVAPPRNRHFLTRCRSADCASTAFRCRCLLLRQKLFVLPCRRLRSNYILCPTGTPTFAAARRQRRDLIIATRPAHQPLPSLLSAAAAQAVQAIPEPTTMSPTAPIPRDQHRQICTCPPRAKGPLDRRFEWFSLVTFFLQKKKVTRAGARNAPPRARHFLIRCRSPDCTSTAFRCRCLLLRQKLFVLPCRRVRNNYIRARRAHLPIAVQSTAMGAI